MAKQIDIFHEEAKAVTAVKALDPDDFTPKEALEMLYKLKSLV